MTAQEQQQQAQHADRPEAGLHPLPGGAEHPIGGQQQRDGGQGPAAQQADSGGRDPLGPLMEPELPVDDGVEDAAQARHAEDQDRPGHGVILPGGADQARLHNGGDPLPEPQAKQHGQGAEERGDQGGNQRLLPAHMLAEAAGSRLFLTARHVLRGFSVFHG